MQFNPWKKKAGQKDGSTPTEAEAQFQEAAREVVAETSPPSPPIDSPASGPEKLAMANISEARARDIVKFCFWPLAHYVDPAWALTDDEAQKASPEMRAFVNWFLTKYAPYFVLTLADRFPELVGMLVAMSLLTWHKAQIVMAAQRVPATVVEPASSEVAPGEVLPIEGEGMNCEECHKDFPSRSAFFQHLPCRKV